MNPGLLSLDPHVMLCNVAHVLSMISLVATDCDVLLCNIDLQKDRQNDLRAT